MKIKSIRPYLKKLALTKPYQIAYDTFFDVELVFLEIELENGILGLGSASPAEEVIGENSYQTLQNLQTDFIRDLIGRDIRHFRQIIFETHQHFPLMAATQAAVDLALHDAFGKFLNIPIVDFYGQKIKYLPTSVTIGIMGVKETLEEAKQYAHLGFKVLKIKTGLDVEEDIERIIRLHEFYKNNLKIRVDANQGYSLQQLKIFLSKTSKTNLELIEQPLKVGQESELFALSLEECKLLAADESLKNAKSALAFSSIHRPFGIFNIKLMKCGGILGALEIANIAQQAHIDLFWGCNDESIASITAALHVAYSCKNTRYLDLDGSFDLAEDLVCGGFALEDGCLKINQKSGFGFEKNA
jgi:L-alanine-DL-glutamate epimerase-like enolase superfamily enzyme